jgi:serine/threonine protein kinase
VLAINELHTKGIMHRDLKLENILVDEKGYLKIIDYGLAKILGGSELATSYCGTPEYLAPEMVDGQGHDKTVDWWALGVLMYEMLTGMTPFFNKNRQLLQNRIKHAKVIFPKKEQYQIEYSDAFVDLVSKLLIKDRTKRLGASGGAKEILAHAFFKGTDVQKFESYQIKPPFVPTQKSETQYFNCNSELDETFLPSEQLQLIKTNQSAFAGFSAGAAKK